MIKHIVMWKFKEDVPEDQKAQLKQSMKENLERLVTIVPGLLEAKYIVQPLATSTHDMALITGLDTVEHLNAYAVHPEHVKVADTYVRPFVCERSCLDYWEEV